MHTGCFSFFPGPDPLGQNLTHSARTKSDPSWFCTITSGPPVEERNGVCVKVRNWQRDGCVLPETGPVDDSCRPACFWTRCVWPKPDQAIQIGSGWVLHNMVQAFFGKTEESRMREGGSGMCHPARFWMHRLAVTKTLPDRIRHVYWVSTSYQLTGTRLHWQNSTSQSIECPSVT